jgi:hypothetical protein
MRFGQLVEVLDAFENTTLKRVVAADATTVWVCREDEFNHAQAENREPVAVGFGREFVVRVMQ